MLKKAIHILACLLPLLSFCQQGLIDPSFNETGWASTNMAGGWDDQVGTIRVQPDGRIVLAGSSYYNFNSNFAFARYNPDGSLDSDFSGDGKLVLDFGDNNEFGTDAVLQPDGKIVAVGRCFAKFAVLRLLPNGSPDSTFGGTGLVTTSLFSGGSTASAVAMQLDGKIVVVGYSDRGNQLERDWVVLRYTSTGQLDSSFNGDGIYSLNNPYFLQSDDLAYTALIQPDGKIVATGAFDTNIGILR